MGESTSYEPAEDLNNRTFIGLIVAQFLAGFNDQAIHAAAMFYAIHTAILAEAKAITLMPILFFAPWAIFCTLAGHFADKYSKTITLRVWKFSEVVISLFLILGFYLGSNADMPYVGGWIVMACVFLMGMHAAFFAPAKYGAMPEILKPHVLSRGNGILESTTFLASILGTVSGGVLFSIFRENPVMIGIILLVLSIIGSAASFLIDWLPAASPEREFPTNLFRPLVENLQLMFRSRPLALAVLGIAFFVFMVAYMRASMLMHGETRNPRWEEQYTSLIVATVALGVGLGSPLAGYVSGGKVELGLVPLGCIGMTLTLVFAAVTIQNTAILVVVLIFIGFFSGFYIVPLYTLLQHRAPKKSKGELVATSNFINVTGAIIASLLFFVLVQLGQRTNITPRIDVTDKVAEGTVVDVKFVPHKHGKIEKVTIQTEKDRTVTFEAASKWIGDAGKEKRDRHEFDAAVFELFGVHFEETHAVEFTDNYFDVLGASLKNGDSVIVSSHELRKIRHYRIRMADQPLEPVYDKEGLPSYLFLGAALMTLTILFLLWWKLPDFFVRSLFWYQSLGQFRLKAVGMQHLPTEGPVILTTDCHDLTSCLQLVSATDRTTKVILVEEAGAIDEDGLLRTMALGSNLILVRRGSDGTISWADAERQALETLQAGHLLAISVDGGAANDGLATLAQHLQKETGAPMLPVFCGQFDSGENDVTPRVRVVFGEVAPSEASLNDCKLLIAGLGEWIRGNDEGTV